MPLLPPRLLAAIAALSATLAAVSAAALAGGAQLDVGPEPVLVVAGAVLAAVAALGAVTLRRAGRERARLEQELARLAAGDPLTGLANRRVFEKTLAGSERGVLLTLTVDGLETLGDVAADRLQREVGERIHARLHRSDVGARIGDGAFAVVAPNTDVAGGMALGFALVDALRGTATVSVGLATLDRADAHADAAAAMAVARRAGGDRLIVA